MTFTSRPKQSTNISGARQTKNLFLLLQHLFSYFQQPHSTLPRVSLLYIIFATRTQWLSSHFDLISFQDQMQTGHMPQFDLLFKSMLKMQDLKTHLRTNEATEGKAYENIYGGCVCNTKLKEESVISVFQGDRIVLFVFYLCP